MRMMIHLLPRIVQNVVRPGSETAKKKKEERDGDEEEEEERTNERTNECGPLVRPVRLLSSDPASSQKRARITYITIKTFSLRRTVLEMPSR